MNCEKRICVIGCGVAGLSALRVFSEDINGFSFTSLHGYERKDILGGIWNYDDEINNELVSPIYRDLKTNLPKELMTYPDFPYPSDIQESFIHHKDVLKYIQSYAKHFDLEKFIEYNSEVINVTPIKTDGSVKWKLLVKNYKSLLTVEMFFDIVLVCNGHFEKPHIPIINGIENFRGECIHSKYYRFPEKYSNQSVFVLGAKSSGLDIALQLLDFAKKVYLSYSKRRLNLGVRSHNLEETVEISHIDSDGNVILVDGSKHEADVIIFCTGYEINLDFLSDSVGLQFDNTYVRPLYKHLINPYFPSSFFIIGLAYEFIPFPHSYIQSKAVRSIVQNCYKDIVLSTDVMIKEIQTEKENYERNGVPMRHRHFLFDKEWPYLRWCEQIAGNIMTANIPRYYQNMSEIVRMWRTRNINEYRGVVFKVSENNELGFVIEKGRANDFYSADFELLLQRSTSAESSL